MPACNRETRHGRGRGGLSPPVSTQLAFVCGEKASLVRLYSLFPLPSPECVSCRSDYSAANLFAVTTPAGNHSFNYHHLSALWFFREGVSTLSFFETQTSRQEQLSRLRFHLPSSDSSRYAAFVANDIPRMLSRSYSSRDIKYANTYEIYRYTDYIYSFIFAFLSSVICIWVTRELPDAKKMGGKESFSGNYSHGKDSRSCKISIINCVAR